MDHGVENGVKSSSSVISGVFSRPVSSILLLDLILIGMLTWCGLVVARGRRSLRQARSRCEWLRGREVAGLRVGSTTRPTLAPREHAPRPLARQSKKRNKPVFRFLPSPFFSLIFSTSFPQSSPKGSVITTSTISVRQARLCVVSGAFSV
jgi:hypothetical protein